MRLLGMTIFLIIIQLATIIFYQNIPANQIALNPYGQPSSSLQLWSFILFPGSWTENSFWVLLTSTLTILGGVTIGTILGLRSDLLYLFALFLLFASFGAVPITSLYLVINSEAPAFACDVGVQSCLTSNLISFFFAGILAAAWIYTCIEWWSGRPAT